jgi:WD40 repeat protein/serine/threonine protein kinase
MESCAACREVVEWAADDRTAKLSRVEGGRLLDALRARQTVDPTLAIALNTAGDGTFTPVVPRRHYEITAEHARGGIGRILRAEDRRLKRPVALKELLHHSDEAAHRFTREAELTARLQHPSIVPVYEAGCWPDGQPFYSMKFISGRSLHERITDCVTFRDRVALLPQVIAVAEAIGYAHSQRVLHRDLKPTNIVVGEFGETMVVDWGMGKDLSRPAEPDQLAASTHSPDPHLTREGAVIGTPAFMSPEQAAGAVIDERADIYALGAILYNVLSGKPPYAGASAVQVIREVIAKSATPVERVQPDVPPDLAAIVAKAMARQPADRYSTAKELVDDLNRFQTGQLVNAHQYSFALLFRRWVRKHKLPTAIAAIFLAIVTLILTASIRRIRDERSLAIAGRNSLILAQARSALGSDPTLAVEWLKTYPLDGTDWSRAQIIAADAQARGIARHLLPGMARSAVLFPDGKRLVTAGPDRQARVWDLASGQLVRAANFPDRVRAVSVSPDGDTLAVGQEYGELVLWNLVDDRQRVLGNQGDGVVSVAFAPAGERLASLGQRSLALWDLTTGQKGASLPSREALTAMAYSPDGSVIVFGSANGTLGLWESPSGRVRLLLGHSGAINDVVFSPDGRQILSGGIDHSVRLWNRATGEGRVVGTHEDIVHIVAFSPSERLIASGGLDHKVRLFSLDGATARVFEAHTDVVNDVRFSPSGHLLASGSSDRQVALWDIESGEARWLRGHRGIVGDTLFTPDGRTLVSAGLDEHNRVWEIPPPPGSVIGRHQMEAVYAEFSSNDDLVASLGGDRLARLWEVGSGHERLLPGAEWSGHRYLAADPTFSDDGHLLAAAGDGAAHVWNLRNAETQVFKIEHGFPRSLSFSPDSARLAVATSNGDIRLFDLRNREQRLLSGHAGEVMSVQFSPTTPVLASVGVDQTVRLWDVASGRGDILGRTRSRPTRMRFAPDGRTLATASVMGDIDLWDLTTQARRSLRGHDDEISGLAFSGDGNLLASSSVDKTARVWNLASGEVRTLRSHDQDLRSIAMTRDGKVVATASADSTIALWNLENGGFAILRGHRTTVRSVRFSTDGRLLVSASDDGTVRLWKLDLVRWVPRDPSMLLSWLQQQTSATLPASEYSSTRPQLP